MLQGAGPKTSEALCGARLQTASEGSLLSGLERPSPSAFPGPSYWRLSFRREPVRGEAQVSLPLVCVCVCVESRVWILGVGKGE